MRISTLYNKYDKAKESLIKSLTKFVIEQDGVIRFKTRPENVPYNSWFIPLELFIYDSEDLDNESDDFDTPVCYAKYKNAEPMKGVDDDTLFEDVLDEFSMDELYYIIAYLDCEKTNGYLK